MSVTFVHFRTSSDLVSLYEGARVNTSMVDLPARSGFSIGGAKPRTAQQKASEYYHVRARMSV